MSSITVRDLPPELHKRLKESAERNRRSLNAEIVSRLETSIEPMRPSKEEIMERADRLRERLRGIGFQALNAEEIRDAIRQGRM